MPIKQIKLGVWRILSGKDKMIISKIINMSLIILILLNIVSFILSTIESLNDEFGNLFFLFEVFSVIIFSVEYSLRIWSCTSDERFNNSIAGRIKFIFTPMAVVDFLSIAPFYLPFLGLDLRMVRILRVFRIFRIFKLGRYSASLDLLRKVFIKKKEELLLTTLIMFALLLISSTLIYYAERDAQPEAFANIPQSIWWSIVTLTTVGYGDSSPVTIAGKIIAGLVAVIGIGFFALPVGIFSSGFVEEIQKRKKGEKCPHCGKKL
jgi:voltage-gated potassium channel